MKRLLTMNRAIEPSIPRFLGKLSLHWPPVWISTFAYSLFGIFIDLPQSAYATVNLSNHLLCLRSSSLVAIKPIARPLNIYTPSFISVFLLPHILSSAPITPREKTTITHHSPPDLPPVELHTTYTQLALAQIGISWGRGVKALHESP